MMRPPNCAPTILLKYSRARNARPESTIDVEDKRLPVGIVIVWKARTSKDPEDWFNRDVSTEGWPAHEILGPPPARLKSPAKPLHIAGASAP